MRVGLELDHHGSSDFVVVCVALDRAGRFPPLEAEGLCHLREADAENWIHACRTGDRYLDHPVPDLGVRARARILTPAGGCLLGVILQS